MIYNSEVTLTYVPSSKEKNRICGHTFEVMDYYLYFKDNNISCKILIQEKIDPEIIYKAYEDKYNKNHLNSINYKDDIVFRPSINKNDVFNNLIITSGIYQGEFFNKILRKDFYYKKIILFPCNKDEKVMKIISRFLSLSVDKHYLIGDKRIYKNKLIINKNNFLDGKKRINFKYFYPLEDNYPLEDKTLIYLNSGFRNLTKEDLNIYLNKFKNVLFVSGDDNSVENFKDYRVLKAPVLNLYGKYNIYLYTKTTRVFDCSPRLLTESYFYNKKILFDFNFKEYSGEDYGDTGLYWRWFDIQNNFNDLDLSLSTDKTLINLIK